MRPTNYLSPHRPHATVIAYPPRVTEEEQDAFIVDVIEFHRGRCPCPSSPIAQVGLAQTNQILVLACLHCGQSAAYKEHVTEPNKGDVIVRFQRYPTSPEVLGWLSAFPRRLDDGEFVPASARMTSSKERVECDSALVDRFIKAGLPGPPPDTLPEGFAGFETVREVCSKRTTATFQQWVKWSLFHPASVLAGDLVLRRPDLVVDLVELLRSDGYFYPALALLRLRGKGHPAVAAWLQDEAHSLDELHGPELTTALDRLAGDAKGLEAVELAPQLRALQGRLDPSAPHYIRKRIERITTALLASSEAKN